MSNARFRRRKWLIDSDIQVRLAAKFATYLLIYFCFFCLIALLEPAAILISGSASKAGSTAAQAEIRAFCETVIMPLGFAVACMTLHGVLILHRLAGPVFCLRRNLGLLADRDLTQGIHLRDGDYLQAVAARYNDTVQTFRMDIEGAREDIAAILEAATDEAVTGPAGRLERLFATYRTGSEAREKETAGEIEEPVGSASGADS